MSENIELNGKTYLPASRAAKHVGVTRDYIGRLCREGKIIGRRVGTTWYVEAGSLDELLVAQQYSKAKRAQELSTQRLEEYRTRQAEPKEEVISNGSLAKTNTKESVRTSTIVSAPVVSSVISHQVSKVPQQAAEALRAAGRRVGASASARAFFEHAPRAAYPTVHAVMQSSGLAHRLLALTFAFALTFGAYGFVDAEYRSVAMDTAHEAVIALAGTPEYVQHVAIASKDVVVAVLALRPSKDEMLASTAGLVTVTETGAQYVQNAVNDFVRRAFSIVGSFASFLPAPNSSEDASVIAEIVASKPKTVALVQQNAGTTVISHPVVERIREIERTVQTTVGGVSIALLAESLEQLDNKLTSQIVRITASGNATYQAVAQTNRIDQLTNTDITTPTITGGSISNTSIGASSLSVSGATSLGNVTISGTATSTNLIVTGTLTAANFAPTALNVTNGTTTNATSTNIYTSGLTLGSLSGFLKATAGVIATSTISLVNDIAGVLGIANGGTGTTTAPTYGKVLLGNSGGTYDLVATSSLGIISGAWGNITGTLSNQTDLQSALDAKFALSSWYATTTDGLTEGTTNKYWSNTFFDNRLSATTTLPNITTLSSLGTVSTSLTGLLKATSGVLSAAVAGTDYLTAATTFAYPFALTGNATSTLVQFNGGLTAYASSTIGSGTQTGGLTISGGATTTGSAYFAGNVGIGTTTPVSKLSVVGESAFAGGGVFGLAYAGVAAPTNGLIIQGNVGIGTNQPLNNFVVSDGGAGGLEINPSLAVGGATGVRFLSYDRSASAYRDFIFAQDGSSTVVKANGTVGIGTTSPWRTLSVNGSSDLGTNALAGYFTATSTTASVFPYASTTALTISGTAYIGSLNGPLQANAGLISATTSIGVLYGGTGLTSAPSYGQVLLGNSLGGYTLTATSSLGITGSSGSGGGQLLATYATSTVGTTTVNFNGASGSAASFSAGVLTLPSNTSYFVVHVVGSGGGSGSGNSNNPTSYYRGGGGGGGGAYAHKMYSSIVANYVFSVGAGGLANASGTPSTFGNGNATTTAGGGGGGASGDSVGGGVGGGGGVAVNGDVNLIGASGVRGGEGVAANGRGGGGGSSAFGGGGAKGADYCNSGVAGNSFGGGAGGAGGGCGSPAGAVGGSGGVVIEVYTTGISNGSLASGTAGQFAYYNAAGTNLSATSSIYIDSTTGKIGIGTTTPWRSLSVNGSSDLGTNALAGYFTATSSTASVFNYASSTALSISGTASTTNLIVSSAGGTAGCATFSTLGVISNTGTACGSGSGTFSFTPTTNFGLTVNSTSTPLWFTNGLMASSTSYFSGIGMATNSYLNFGAATGTTGYGFRDNAGTMEFKNSGGAWNSVNTATSGPSFSVHKNGTNQTVVSATPTLLTWSTERFDTNNNFASNKFTPTVAGKYIVTLSVYCLGDTTGCASYVYKNGSVYAQEVDRGTDDVSTISVLIDMNGTTDYIEAYGRNDGSTTLEGSAALTFFTGALIAPVSQIAGGWSNDGTQSYLSDSTDKVGIGTSTPNSALNIAGTAPKLTLTDTSAGSNLKHWFLQSTGGTFKLGTTSDALTDTSSSPFSVSGSGFGTTTLSGLTISGQATSTSNVGFNISTGCFAINNVCVGGGSGGVGSGTTGQFGYYAGTGTDLTATSTLFLNTNSRIGIATSSPLAQLDVYGDAIISGSNRYLNFGATSGTSGYGLRDNSGTLEFKNSGGAWNSVNTATTGPSFSVNKGGTAQTVVDNTDTLITWSAEAFDTNNNFDLATERFTPTVAGKYIITVQLRCSSTSNCWGYIYKNGSLYAQNTEVGTNSSTGVTVVIDMNGTTDYVEAWGAATGGTSILGTSPLTFFTGALIAPVSAIAGGWSNDGTQSYMSDSLDYVGIGTTTPWGRLSINPLATDGTAPAFVIGSSTATNFIVTNAGNVGIGTSTANYRLSIQNSANSTFGIAQYSSAGALSTGIYNGNDGRGLIYMYDAAGTNQVKIGTGDSSYFNGGNVGIGTSTPWGLLSVNPNGIGTAPAFVIGSSTATNFIVTNAGKVGIGVTAPGQELDIAGDIRITGSYEKTDANGYLMFATRAADAGNYGVYFDSTNGDIETWTSNTRRTTLTSTGFFGVANAAPSVALDVTGDIEYTGTITDVSDERLKENIVDIENPFSVLSAVDGKKFNMIGSTENSVGFLAQNVQTVLPDSVHIVDPENGYLGVSYLDFIPYLVEGVNELNTRTKFIDSHSTSTILTVTENGNIGIGTTTPMYKLHVGGEIAAEGFINASSREFKTDITGITGMDEEDILATIASTSIAHYRYKDEDPTNPLRIGLIAEEAPMEVLSTTGKGVDVYQLATFTLAGVKAQQRNIESLGMRVAALEEALAATSTEEENAPNPIVAAVNSWLSSIGIAFSDTVASFNNLAASAFTVGSKEKPSGITLYDEETGEAYCVKVKGGAMVNVPGTCEQVAKQGEHAAPTLDVQGANPASINIGDTYNDLGVIAKDWNGNDLSIRYFVDGIHMSAITLDTASSTTYTIEYSATDTDGLSATSTRTVIVGDGSPAGDGAGSEQVPVESAPATTPESVPVPVDTATTTVEVVPVATTTPDTTSTSTPQQ